MKIALACLAALSLSTLAFADNGNHYGWEKNGKTEYATVPDSGAGTASLLAFALLGMLLSRRYFVHA